MTPRVHTAFGVFGTIVVAAAIGWGFYLVGSPGSRREQRFDEHRLQDLQTIAREIRQIVVDPNDEAKIKDPLPATLEAASEQARNQQLNPRDPETDEPYKYTVTGESTFELCANFSRALTSESAVFWNHPAGEHCYKINVLDPPTQAWRRAFSY